MGLSHRLAAGLVGLAWLIGARAQADTVRVGLFRKAPPTTIRVSGPCVVECATSGRHKVPEGNGITLRYSANGVLVERAGERSIHPSIRLRGQDKEDTIALGAGSGTPRRIRGEIVIRPVRNCLLVVNEVDVEEYMRSVLPSEMPHEWPFQALAAQAVVARSFALGGRGRHTSDGFDLCDLTHCQVYRGASWERASTDRAAKLTAGEILVFRGKCIAAPYHSTCGGRTTARGDPLANGFRLRKEPACAYLQSVVDGSGTSRFCSRSNHYTWTSSLSAPELKRALGAEGYRVPGGVSDIRVIEKDESGRAAILEVTVGRRVRLSGSAFMMAVGRRLGWNKVKSTLFTVRKSGGSFVFTGKGLGHGMGLCQWGARGMAEQGRSYQDILAHYFPRCNLARR